MEVAVEWGPDEADLIGVALRVWHSLTPWLRYEKRNWRVMYAHRLRGDMGRVGGALAHWRRSAMISKEYSDQRDTEKEATSVFPPSPLHPPLLLAPPPPPLLLLPLPLLHPTTTAPRLLCPLESDLQEPGMPTSCRVFATCMPKP